METHGKQGANATRGGAVLPSNWASGVDIDDAIHVEEDDDARQFPS